MLSRISARRHRRRTVRALKRRMAELDRLDREYGLGTMPTPYAHRRTRARRTGGPVLPGLLISAVLLTGVVAVSPDENMRTLRRLTGFQDDRRGDVPDVVRGSGSFEFTLTQRVGKEPVGYDPCRPIEIAVNPEGAPEGYDELVDTAIRHTSEATGLRFVRVGTTDDRDFSRRHTSSGARPPVLVAWATADELPDLAGDVAGLGGSVAVDPGTGRLRYVTGIVVLDRDAFAGFPDDEAVYAQALVDHEFGHLVGLGHVTDPGELMNEDNLGVTTYGPGDREGLARIGGIDC